MNNNNNERNMVGGYSSVDTELLLSTEIMDVANFCLNEYASKFAASDNYNYIAGASSFVVLPQDVESGDVVVKVLEAQRQVVAGINYKLTISIHNKSNNNMCLGGIKDITIYKALPYMNQPLKVTSFGTILDGEDESLLSLIDSVNNNDNKVQEEGNALEVEKKIEKDVKSAPGTEEELAHYSEILVMVQKRWSGMTPEAKKNMTAVNEDPVLREESNEFLSCWASADSNGDGRLSQDEFVFFNTKHLANILKRLGWAPSLTEEDSRLIWKAIYNLNRDNSGISIGQYGRYHACMKVYIN